VDDVGAFVMFPTSQDVAGRIDAATAQAASRTADRHPQLGLTDAGGGPLCGYRPTTEHRLVRYYLDHAIDAHGHPQR
jgi:hypothetical protein